METLKMTVDEFNRIPVCRVGQVQPYKLVRNLVDGKWVVSFRYYFFGMPGTSNFLPILCLDSEIEEGMLP